MTHVVSDACINCRYTDCVAVCPVECFHAGPNFVVIDPLVCIDCALCVPECPVQAIQADGDLPAAQQEFLALNEQLAQQWPVLKAPLPPLPQAGQWRDEGNKRGHLQTQP